MKNIIFGGAGFIGCNLAARLIRAGEDVVVFDNLSRTGTENNIAWLQELGPMSFIKGDVRDPEQVNEAILAHADARVIYHMAAQVAVTTSLEDPREDFEVNALGTFNLLEAVRTAGNDPIFVFASTNKVYGTMTDVPVVERNGRYAYRDLAAGVSEHQGLDFHSPYGCSKGAADQYVRDYARIYGLRTITFRQSCIYGLRQFGVEDQGWVAWFTIASVLGLPVTLYGDGKQVRDVLFVDDLLDAYQRAVERIEITAGKIYNIGGGPSSTLSLLELLELLNHLNGRPLRTTSSDWRPGDQKVFICDIRKARQDFGWAPRIGPNEGVERLREWAKANLSLFDGKFPPPPPSVTEERQTLGRQVESC